MQLSGMQLFSLLLVGGIIGTISGMLGIGGGVLVIPVLVTIYHFSYPQAVGTSLGMLLPPIGIFAFLTYYRSHNVHISTAAMLAAGFAVGAYFGGKLVTTGVVPEEKLRIFFGFFLLYVGGSTLFRGDPHVRPVLYTLILLLTAAVANLALRLVGRRWEKQFSIAETYQHELAMTIAPDYEI